MSARGNQLFVHRAVRLLALLMFVGAWYPAQAAYVNRYSITTNGAVTFTGNTLGLNKVANQNAPGTSGAIGAFITTNIASQVNTYPAGTTLTWQNNSSSAVLTIPAGSTILYAELIWGGSYSYGGQNVSGSLGSAVTFTTPLGSSAVSPVAATSQTLGVANAAGTCTTAPCYYVRSANVTALVVAAGAGTFTVGGVPATVGAAENSANNAGWTLAVVYSNSALPARNMNVFVGAETGGNAAATVSGFCTPPTGPRSGRLMVSAMEGDSGITGDQMQFGPTAATLTPLSGPNNLVTNFFSSQINGDTGTLNTTGTFGSSNQPNNAASTGRQGYDITNVDVSATLANGQTTGAAQGTTTGDQYVINALGLQINVGAPSFPVATKSVNKATTYVGDTVTYTIVLDNTTGTADATNVVFTDSPPPGTTFVANSLTLGGVVQSGANPATGFNVGTIAAGTTKTITFKVTVTSLPASPAAAQFANSATWTYQYVPCTGQATVNGSLTTNPPVISTAARLEPTKTVSPSGPVSPGQALSYTISVPNTGTANSAGTTLADPIPAGVTYVAGSTKLNGTPVADVAGAMPYAASAQINSPTRPAGQVNAGETATITFNVTVNATTTSDITNTATVDVDGTGPAPAVTTQITSGLAKLVPTKTVSPTGAVSPGQILTYTITVPNSGSAATSGTTLLDPLPVGTSYVAGSTTLNGVAVPDVSGAMPFASAAQINSPTRPTGQIFAGETATIVFKATVTTTPGAGPLVNTATIDPDGPGAASAVSAQASSPVLLPDLLLTKSHVGSFSVGSTGSYTLQVLTTAGSGAVNSGPITVTDSLPSGLTVAAVPTGTNWNCTSTVVGSVTASCTFTGTFPVAASTSLPPIALVVSVAASAVPSVTNSAAVSTAPGESNTTNNTATDVTAVIGKPTISKAFTPTNIATGGTAVLTLTLNNANASALSAVAFTDAFPAGLIVAATPALTNTCSGSVSGASAGSASLGLSGGVLAASGNCNVTVTVTALAGTYTNTSGGVSSMESGSAGPASNAAVLTAVNAPSIAKSFTPAIIGVGETSTLTVTLINSGGIVLTGVAFNDAYPTNMTNASPASLTNTCGGAVSGSTPGGNSVGLSGATLAPASSCTLQVQVTAASASVYVNNTSAVTAANGGSGNAASATLAVLLKPTIAKSFSPANIASNGTSSLTLQLSNPNGVSLTGVAFTDAFPSGLLVAPTPALSNSCGGSIGGGTAGSNSLGLTGGTLPANGSCTMSVAVTASTPGGYTNTAGGVSSTEAGSAGPPSNAAVLTVLTAPVLSKSFTPSVIGIGGLSTLSVTLSNSNAVAVTGAAFSDNYPTGLLTAVVPNVVNTCGGTLSGGSAGSTTVGLSGGTIPAGATCSLSVAVTSAINGSYVNVSGVLSSTNAGTGNSASATLLVAANPTIAKSFAPSTIATGATASLTFTLNNSFPTPLTGVAFTDSFPTGLVVAATPALSTSCGGTVSGASAGSTSITLTNGTLASSASCTITVSVTAGTQGNYANTTGPISSAQTGAVATSNTAVLQVLTPPTIAKSFSPSTVLVNSNSTLTLVISNPNTIALTGLSFSDTFPAGLAVSALPTATNTCGGSLNGVSPGAMSFTLTGGALPAGSSSTCTISLQVTSSVPGNLTNSTSGVSSSQASTGAGSNASILVVVAPDLQLSKTHSGNFTVGATAVYTLTVNNLLGTGASGGLITVSDTLPAGLSYVAAGSGGSGWACSANPPTVTCTTTSSVSAGGSASPITIYVDVAAIAIPGVTNLARVSGGAEPAVYANNNAAADFTIVNAANLNQFLTDGQLSAQPGATVFYPHTFVAGIAGTVSFNTTDVASPVLLGWSALTYADSNCNGVIDGSEGGAPLTGSVPVAPGDRVCLLVKVFVPASATFNAQDQVTIDAVFLPSAPGPSVTLTRTDLTTVATDGALLLHKTVRNVSTGGSSGTANTVTTGNILEYSVDYSNSGNTSLQVIVINDETPAYATFVSALCVTPLPAALSACAVTAQPPAGATGSIAWTLSGSLAPGATGTVKFQVTVR